MKKRLHIGVLGLLVTMFSASVLLFPAMTHAATPGWGRGAYYGYFDNALRYWGYNSGATAQNGYVLQPTYQGFTEAFPTSLDSVPELMNLLQTVYAYDYSGQSMTAFIVNTMLGRNAPGSGRTVSAADWTDLNNRLTGSGITIGWFDFHVAPHNTYHQSTANATSLTPPSLAARANDANDVGWASASQSGSAIVIRHNGTPVYALFRSCANPDGDLPGIPAPPAAPASATISANAAPSITINPGQSASFTQSISVTGASNTGSDTYVWAVTGTSPVGNTTRQISSGGVTSNTASTVYNAPGSYCRTIRVIWAPAYVTVPAGSATQCINVVSAGAYQVAITGAAHEKGSGSKTITYDLRVITAPCDASQANGAPIDVDWSTNAPGGISNARTASVANCTAVAGSTIDTATIVVTGATLDARPVGPYGPFTGTVNGAPNGSISISVFEVPYVRFVGQDILACTGEIRTNNNYTYSPAPGGTTRFGGGGSQLAAIARTTISGLATAFSRTAVPLPAGGLASQNSNFSCPTLDAADFATLPTQAGGTITLNNADIANTYTSDVVIDASAVATAKSTINVEGDVYIRGNITGVSTRTTGPAVLIRAHNIYIQYNVSQIDAVLVATGSGGLGKIYTCAVEIGNAFFRVAQSTWHTSCTTKLTVNGSLMANEINFARSTGTRLAGATTETTNGSGLGTAAEVVNYPTYLNFVTFNMPSRATQGFDTYYSLPPRL